MKNRLDQEPVGEKRSGQGDSGQQKKPKIEMRIAGQKKYTIWEWVVLCGLLVFATVLTNLIGLTQELSDAVVFTVVVFAVIITALRPAWGRRTFWKNLVLVLALHIVGVVLLLRVLPREWHGVPGSLMIIAGMVEGLLVGGLLWRKTVRARQDQRF